MSTEQATTQKKRLQLNSLYDRNPSRVYPPCNYEQFSVAFQYFQQPATVSAAASVEEVVNVEK